MRILSIETSCDETGISLLDIDTQDDGTQVEVLANELTSQASEHEEYGGVYPTLAKRLHAQNFPHLLARICDQVATTSIDNIPKAQQEQIQKWLKRHPGYANGLIQLIQDRGAPTADVITVTVGPGLEPALWVGINTARSISLVAETPVMPVNHMRGHLLSTCVPHSHDKTFRLQDPPLPAVALLVSGGHTELIHVAENTTTKIGQTRDDAAGEAFDKVGRLLDLPYPAGPHVSQLAQKARQQPSNKDEEGYTLPRPMIDADNCDFSFSGLKTAAARLIKKRELLDEDTRACIAQSLESAIVDVLAATTKRAAHQVDAQAILAGGGVTANTQLREQLQDVAETCSAELYLCPLDLATDNAVMIGLAGFASYSDNPDEAYLPPANQIGADSRLAI